MATYTWTGADGADWSLAGDWSPASGPPGISDTADILSGGTVSVGEAQSIEVLSLGAGAQLLLSAAPFTVAGSVDNGGLILVGGTLVVAGSAVTLSGAGTLALGGANDSSVIAAATAGEALVNAGAVIAGTGTIGAGGLEVTNEAGGVIDAATLTATAATLTVGSAGVAMSNAGLMEATTGALVLAGDIANGGTIAAAGGTVDLSAAIINGGTLSSSGTSEIYIGGGQLNGSVALVTNIATIDAVAAEVLGAIVNDGTIGGTEEVSVQNFEPTFASAGAVLALVGTVTLTGTGEVANNTIESAVAGAVLVNVSNTITMNTIVLTGDLLDFPIHTTAPTGVFDVGVTNEAAGVIAGGTFDLGAVNSGMIANALFTTHGSVTSGSVIDQTGGGTITNGKIDGAATVEGGTFAGDLLLDGAGPQTLDGSVVPITNLGGISALQSGVVDLLGSFDNVGGINTFGQTVLGLPGLPGSQFVVASATVTLSGGGNVELLGYDGGLTGGSVGDEPYPLGAIAAAATGDVLVNVDNTISGGEGIGSGGLVLDNEAAGLIEATSGTMTLDPLSLTNAGTLEADGANLVITTGTYTDLTGSWIADNSTIALPAPNGFAGVAGDLALLGTAAEFVSSTGTGVPSLTNSYLAPETILAGGAIAVFNGATFGIAVTPTNTSVVGPTTIVTGGSLELFGNAGLLWLAAGGTADLDATVTNTGAMFGNGSLIVSGAVMNNTDGTVEANGGLLTFQGALSGGKLALDPGASLELSPGWFGGGGVVPLSFEAGNDLLKIDVTDNAGSFSNVGSIEVNSFAFFGETIAVDGTVAGGGVFPGFSSIGNDGTTLTFIEGAQTLGAIGFAGGTAHLVLSQDANHDEIITIAPFTWTGTNGADWGIAGDWSPAGGPPGTADGATVLTGGAVNVGEAQSIDVLNLAAGAMLSIASGVAFTVLGGIDGGGTVFDVGTLMADGPAVTLDGGAAIGLTGSADTAAVLAAGAGDTLVNVNDTISGGGALGGGTLGLTNEAGGVIDAFAFFAAPATLEVNVAGTLVNAGLMEATTGTLESSGPVANSGTVKVTGNVLALNGGADNTGLIEAAGGTLEVQGSITNSALIEAVSGAMTLDGAVENSSGTIETTGGTLDLPGTVMNSSLIEGIAGSLLLTGTVENTGGTILSVDGAVTLDGIVSGGTLAGFFADPAGTLDIPDTAAGTLTIDSNVGIGLTTSSLDLVGTVINNSTVAVSQMGTIVNGSIDLLGTLDNTGVLSGGGPPGHPFVFSGPGSIDNTGSIAATAGGTFVVQGLISNAGVMDGKSGSLILQGPIFNQGGTIEGATTDGQVTIDGTGELDGSAVPIRNLATIIAQRGDVEVLGSIDNAGTITTVSLPGGPPLYFGDSGVLVVGSPTVTLGGGGQVQLSGRVADAADNAIIAAATGDLLVNVNNTISGQQGIGAGGLMLDNQAAGLIEAMGSAFPMTLEPIMTLDPIGLSNEGTLEADGATLDITAGTFTNTGTLFGNGNLIASGAVMNNVGGTVEANGGLLTFQGALVGGQVAVDSGATLELSSGWFGGGGAIPVSFDAGSDLLQIDVADNAGTFSNVGSVAVNAFVFGDTIVVHGSVVGGGVFPGFDSIANDGTTLAFVEGGETLGTLGFAGGTSHVVLSQDSNNDEIITAACFAAGTRILTARGDVAVEALRLGDMVPTLRGGGSGTVRWLGFRNIDCTRHPRPQEVWPIRVQAGAFGFEVPRRDLWLSRDHAVYVGGDGEDAAPGVLIPVRYLVNGASIAQMEVSTIAYWHVELDRHDIILAEGLAAESYLDTGNRSAFANGGRSSARMVMPSIA